MHDEYKNKLVKKLISIIYITKPLIINMNLFPKIHIPLPGKIFLN
jgi:hypothetical protein